MHVDLQAIKSSRSELLSELAAAGCKIRHEGREIQCGFHQDDHASAGIYEKEGCWYYKCNASSCGVGGDIFDIRAAATNRKVEDVIAEYAKREAPRSPIQKPKEKPETVYPTLERLTAAVKWVASEKLHGSLMATYIYTNPVSRNHDMVVFQISYFHDNKQHI